MRTTGQVGLGPCGLSGHGGRLPPLLAWARKLSKVRRAGVEGTGSFGAGLSRYLLARQVQVYEVNRPDRTARRLLGKSDPLDAQAAALAEPAPHPARRTPRPAAAHTGGHRLGQAITLLITMGNSPERLSTEASFAAWCGVSPIEYSSGRRTSRRLNHGGDRQANAALHRIVFTRLRFDPRTQA